jgi:hypothetical protein
VGIGFLIGLERQFTKQVKHKEEQFAEYALCLDE